MSNLKLYDQLRSVPSEAQKIIKGGRISGMTDINPMWRIKKLTETFGICGFGWKYEIKEQRLERGIAEGASFQISAFVTIDLFVKIADVWSDAIPGIGGSSFVAQESTKMYQSDECFKMALTDALSVACKAIGVGADIYFQKDAEKTKAVGIQSVLTEIEQSTTKDELKQIWLNNQSIATDKEFLKALSVKKALLKCYTK